MKNLAKKLNNRKAGFTLAELLIVVAIIGVLVAVSIPIFTSQLEKSRENTDLANMRAAKAAAVTAYLDASDASKVNGYYDAAAGAIVPLTNTTLKAYGKGTEKNGGATATAGYDNETDYTDQVIKITCDNTTGEITIGWADAPAN